MSLADYEPSVEELEALLINNHDFEMISSYLNRFNPIRVMKMERMEIRHSAILAWLLDPSETHGLGDKFLRGFLAEALRDQSAMGRPNALEISQSDLRDVEVRREWNNIDLLLLSERNGWVFIVENKYYSSQHTDQLSRYVGKVKTQLASVIDAYNDRSDREFAVRGIFLTLLDEEPQDDAYAPIRYSKICDLLEPLINQEAQAVREDVRMFINQYLEVIQEEGGMSAKQSKIEVLARDIYRRNKRVLDFIIEKGAGTDFNIAVDDVFGIDAKLDMTVKIGGNDYVYFAQNSVLVSFMPASWMEKFDSRNVSWPLRQAWWQGFPMICWFQIAEDRETKNKDGTQSGTLWLYAEVGPLSDIDFRRSLVNHIKDAARANGLKNIRFQSGAEKETAKYSKFLKNNKLEIGNVHDVGQISDAMRKLMKKLGGDLEAIAEGLEDFQIYGTSLTN